MRGEFPHELRLDGASEPVLLEFLASVAEVPRYRIDLVDVNPDLRH